jgi:PAS domain S-box-containing protein
MPAILRARLAALADDALAASRKGGDPDAILRSLLGRIPFAALVADSEGLYVGANEAAATLTGYSTSELRRLSVWQLTPMGEYHEAETLWRAFLASGEQTGAYDIVRKDGQMVAVDYAARAHVLPRRHISLLRPIISTFAQAAGSSERGDSPIA